MILILCDTCLQPFLDDRNYTVACVWRDPLHEPEKHENECFICSRRGRDYDIDKKPKR